MPTKRLAPDLMIATIDLANIAAILPSATVMLCRLGCGACCIAPSISSAIPDMPNGKPAGVRCVQLDAQNLCKLFGLATRPVVCGGLQPSFDMCGSDHAHAQAYLTQLEQLTQP